MIITKLLFKILASKILAADFVYNFDVKNEVNITKKHYIGFFDRESVRKSSENLSINHFITNKAHKFDTSASKPFDRVHAALI